MYTVQIMAQVSSMISLSLSPFFLSTNLHTPLIPSPQKLSRSSLSIQKCFKSWPSGKKLLPLRKCWLAIPPSWLVAMSTFAMSSSLRTGSLELSPTTTHRQRYVLETVDYFLFRYFLFLVWIMKIKSKRLLNWCVWQRSSAVKIKCMCGSKILKYL